MKKYVKHTRHFLQKRGHMVSFLLIALMISSWIGTFEQSVNMDIISFYMQ